MKFMFLILIMVSSPKSNQYIFTTLFEIRDQGKARAGRFCIYVWVAFPYFGLKIAVGDLLRPWLCFIQLIIIIFIQGEWRKRRLDDQKFSLLFASILCTIFTILVTFLKILNHLHHFVLKGQAELTLKNRFSWGLKFKISLWAYRFYVDVNCDLRKNVRRIVKIVHSAIIWWWSDDVLKSDDKNFSIVNWHDFLPQICRRSIAK